MIDPRERKNFGSYEERCANPDAGMVVMGDHIVLGAGRIIHLKQDFIDHCLDRFEKDHELTIRDIEKEYCIKMCQLYNMLRKAGIDQEFIAELRAGI